MKSNSRNRLFYSTDQKGTKRQFLVCLYLKFFLRIVKFFTHLTPRLPSVHNFLSSCHVQKPAPSFIFSTKLSSKLPKFVYGFIPVIYGFCVPFIFPEDKIQFSTKTQLIPDFSDSVSFFSSPFSQT